MYIGIALLNDRFIQNIAKRIAFVGSSKYDIKNDSLFLPPHISLKQSFPFDGDISEVEHYFDKVFSKVEPLKVKIKDIGLLKITESAGILWFDICETSELRNLHVKLCRDLKQNFGIEPLGFDGLNWKFHSTIINSKSDVSNMKLLFDEFKGKYMDVDFNVTEVVMFCCLGNPSDAKDYFTYKIIPIG